jgi:hypothetical protein
MQVLSLFDCPINMGKGRQEGEGASGQCKLNVGCHLYVLCV